MTLTAIITWVALFAIGFYAGSAFVKSKMGQQIKTLKRQIKDLQEK